MLKQKLLQACGLCSLNGWGLWTAWELSVLSKDTSTYVQKESGRKPPTLELTGNSSVN